MRNAGLSSMKARLRHEIVSIQHRIERTAKLNNRPRRSTTLAVLHGAGGVGQQWSDFIQRMFTEELPEQYRDMNLDVIEESVTNLGEDDVCNINNCEYKMLIVDAEVLRVLRDEQSVFRRCEIMETQQEQVIILTLANKDDANFFQDVKNVLNRLKDNEAYSVIQAKDPNQIFSDIMTIMSPMYVVPQPNILSSEDTDQHLTLLSNKPYPAGPKLEYVVEFILNGNSKQMSASLFNPYTLLVSNPGHPPGLVTLRILICTHNPHTESNIPEVNMTQIGEDITVWFQSDLDKVFSVLDSQTNPVSFLCQAMKVSEHRDPDRTSIGMVDKFLTESFKKYVPDNKLSVVFGNTQSLDDDQNGCRTEYMPTLLHFSAMYGLRDLTAALLQCPGAVQAYGTANCDGDYPTDLAAKYSHWDLREFMHTYIEVAAMVHDDYGERGGAETSQIMSCMVYGQYLSFAGGAGVPEDIYVPIGEDFMNSISTPPGYVPMNSFSTPAPNPTLPQSVDYDFMIKRMLQSNEGDDPEKVYDIIPSAALPNQVNLRHHSTAPSVAEETPPILPPRQETLRKFSVVDPKDSMLLLPKNTATLSPAQQELISLQKKVKDGEISINQAVFRFKDWEKKHKERQASFQFQQENLMRFRQSLMKSREERKERGDLPPIEISQPLVAGSSTYDRVLLRTRHDVMEKNAHSDVDGKNGKRVMGEGSIGVAKPNHYSHSGEPNLFANRTSFKGSRIGRPPAPLPDHPLDKFSRFRISLDSQGSSIRSHSSSSSGGFNPPFLPPRIPGLPSRNTPRSSISDEPPIPPFKSATMPRDSWSSNEAPPPVPPRDDRMSFRTDQRPSIPPRNPHSRIR